MWEGGAVLPPAGRGENIIQENNSAQLFRKVLKKKTMRVDALLLIWRTPRSTPPLWKTTYLSWQRHVRRESAIRTIWWGLYKELGTQHKAWDGTTPTLRSTEISAVPHGPARGGAASQRCTVFSGERGGQTCLPEQFCYVIMWSN